MSNGGFGRRGARHNEQRSPSTPADAPKAAPSPWHTGSPLVVGLSILCGVIAFVGGSWLGREAVGQLFAWRASGQMQSSMAEMEKQARAKYPHLDPIEALSLHARETTPGFVAASKTDRERAVKAAATFFGFYHINTRSRVEHCAKHGVDIKAFAGLVERQHRMEYSRALAIATDAGMTEERLWSTVRSQLATLVKADMAAVARRLLTSPQGACRVMVERADEFADKLDFATLQPQVRRILLGS
jgi:hypothetical protein